MTQPAKNSNRPTGAPAKRRLPLGIQTFRLIREEGCYYVDKTPYIRRLVDEGRHYRRGVQPGELQHRRIRGGVDMSCLGP